MPKISIIVPVYKTADKLARCINSFLKQTFYDFELILVDDGSPDDSGRICDEYAEKDNRIKAIHQVNSGVSAARNAGIKTAKGKYIGFADSDDYVSENHLAALISTAECSNVDIAMCNYNFAKENGAFTKMCHGFDEGTIFDENGIKNILYRNIFVNKDTTGYFSLWNKIFKQSLIVEYGILMREDMSFGEDMLFVLDCLKHCRNIAFTENAGYYYYMAESGLFSKYRRDFINNISICYNEIINQTAPKSCFDNDLIPLSTKYWNYINRQISGIVKNEKHKFLQIKGLFSNNTVKKVFSVMANMSELEMNIQNIQPNELKPAKLLNSGYYFLAAFVADYQFNENFWLRRIKRW